LNRAFIAVFGIAVFAAILFGSLAFDSVLAAKEPKVTICHVDPDGDGAGLETLEVNGHSLTKHLAHGDHVGACFVCGDGFEEGAEQCDDGNTVTEECEYGEESCTVCTESCTEQAGATSFCGDDIADVANGEQCDGTDLNQMECEDILDGFNPEGNLLGNLQGNVKGYIELNGLGELACNNDCNFDFSGCFIG